MKKILLSIAVAAALSTQGLYANGPVSDKEKAVQTLNKEFSGAKYVSWTKLESEDLYQASFIYQDQRFNAYFDNDGGLVAFGRYITEDRLPMLVAKTLHSKYSDFTAKDFIELVKNGETSYVISLENESSRMTLQIYDNGGTVIHGKSKKS